jgi:2'-5' RNA ligase
MRVFISVELPEEIKKEILEIQNQLPEFRGKKTEFENLHLTLKFLGEISEEQVKEVRKRLKEIRLANFEALLAEIGVFSPSFIKIIWVRLENCDKLQEEIDEKLDGLFKKEKRFMGHITIARVKSVKDKRKFLSSLKEAKYENKKFKAGRFLLKESTLTEDRPLYKTIEEYKLA